MIAKGNTHDNGARLARYIVTGKDGELAELWELRGFALRDITDAFRSVHVMAKKSQCKQPFFHLQVRNPEGETLSRSQWQIAIEKFESMLGLRDQPRAIAAHTDRGTGHEHLHIAWSRVDPETLKTKALPFFKLRLKKACREIERELELTPVSSDRKSLIRFAPKRNEEQQSIRLGVAINDAREILKAAFERSDCGRSFLSALGHEGLILARGDRRDFVAIDQAGGMHALGKRILGTSAAEIRVRLSDLSPEQLPSVEEARQSLRSITPNTAATEKSALPLPGEQREEGVTQLKRSGKNSSNPSSNQIANPVVPHQPGAQQSPATAARLEEPSETIEASGNKPQPLGLAASFKRQFQATVKALFKRTLAPQPQARRRRTGETVGTYRMVARSLLKPIIRLPPISRAVGFLNETWPWLHLWEWNETSDHDLSAEPQNENDNHLSPHP